MKKKEHMKIFHSRTFTTTQKLPKRGFGVLADAKRKPNTTSLFITTYMFHILSETKPHTHEKSIKLRGYFEQTWEE